VSERTHKLILEIEVPDFNVDGVPEMLASLSADGYEVSLFDTLEDEWMRLDVALGLVSVPGEKCMSDEFEVHAMNGRIVGARIEPLPGRGGHDRPEATEPEWENVEWQDLRPGDEFTLLVLDMQFGLERERRTVVAVDWPTLTLADGERVYEIDASKPEQLNRGLRRVGHDRPES
jgi:hypothetical protein